MAIFSLGEINAKIKNLLELNQAGQKIVKIRKISLKNVTVVLNPRTAAIPYNQAIIKDELARFDKQKADNQKLFFVREDQLDELQDMLYPGKNYDAVLKKIKPFVSDDDYGALTYSAMICKKENAGIEARQLILKLKEAYDKRGLTLYNWLRCGDVFPQDIFPYLTYIIRQQNVNTISVFTLFWENLIKFHHCRIFVHSWMIEEELLDDILKRAVILKIKKIYVYARKGRIPFAEKIIKKALSEDLKQFNLQEKSYTFGTGQAKTFILSSE